ncbi:MAG TPA: GTP cyclohydrolase I [Polyangiaceae bacterium]
MSLDPQGLERAVADFLRALGQDPERVSDVSGTPARVAEAWIRDLMRGYSVDLEALIREGAMLQPSAQSAGVVVVRDVFVATVCPHHLMPALGTAVVAYKPGPLLLGVGTIASIVDALSRRLTLQEQIGANVVQSLLGHAQAMGAYCELTLTHTCLSARGAGRERAAVTTVTTGGWFEGQEGKLELMLALGKRAKLVGAPTKYK